ncbi:hypothetical protein ACFFLS_25230 [Flavobacterium procerum]|uniref:Beta-carotene 15,15'-monooxygenase n=1 Tax=Flavobacterium procerum TaxID=1455569 RepID=A0ABV6BY38_9FLAO
MKSTLSRIEDIKRNGYSLDFSTVFNHAFENYKKIALYSGLIILVFSILFGMAFMAGLVTYLGIENISKDFIERFDPQNLTYVELLSSTAAISLITALVAPFGAGFLKMADSADQDITFNVSTIFTYYKAPYFAQIFIASFIPTLIGTSIANFLDSIGVLLVGNLISFIISYFMFLTIPLVIFGNLRALDAIKGSLAIVTKDPITIFAFFIVGFFGSMVGFFACCIGVIFTAVFNTSVAYAVYFAIFGVENTKDPIDSIGESDFKY